MTKMLKKFTPVFISILLLGCATKKNTHTHTHQCSAPLGAPVTQTLHAPISIIQSHTDDDSDKSGLNVNADVKVKGPVDFPYQTLPTIPSGGLK